MHKFLKEKMDCLKGEMAQLSAMADITPQQIDDMKDWADAIASLMCAEKDYKIIEAMDKAEDEEEKMAMIEKYTDYPDKAYYDNYRYANGRFAPKGRGTRRYYVPDMMYYDDLMPQANGRNQDRDMDRDMGRMYYTSPNATTSRDLREGRSGMSRRMFYDSKMEHKSNNPTDLQEKMRKAEKYIDDTISDAIEMFGDEAPEIKSMAKQKFRQNLVEKM